MNKTLPFLIFAFSAICLPAQVIFKSATIEKVKTEVISDGVFGFVYVHGTWCVSCQVMEETTFESEAIQNVLSEKYNTYKIDFDSNEGKVWAAEFDICCLPTMLFFDEKGRHVQKIQAPLTSTALAGILKKPSSYNSKPAPAKAPVYETTEYSDGTIMMEEISFSEANPKPTSPTNPKNTSATLAEEQNFTKEIIEYSEQRNNATSEQKKGEFLYHLSSHIESLEALYIEYAISDRDQFSDVISKIKTPATDEKIPVFSSQKMENSQLIKDTETLYELIQELKDWDERLRNTDYDIRSMLVADSKKALTPKEKEVKAKEPTANFHSFHVQMGYFKNKKFAKRMVKDLKVNYDYSIELQTVQQPKGTFHRVLLGNFTSERDAEKVYKMLKKEGRKGFVKKR